MDLFLTTLVDLTHEALIKHANYVVSLEAYALLYLSFSVKILKRELIRCAWQPLFHSSPGRAVVSYNFRRHYKWTVVGIGPGRVVAGRVVATLPWFLFYFELLACFFSIGLYQVPTKNTHIVP